MSRQFGGYISKPRRNFPRRAKASKIYNITNNTIAGTIVGGSGNRANFVQRGYRLSIKADLPTTTAGSSRGLRSPNDVSPPLNVAHAQKSSLDDDTREAFQEYARTGRVARENAGRVRKTIQQLVDAEQHVKKGQIHQGLGGLMKASATLSAHYFNLDLICDFVNDQISPVRSAILYFCAANTVQTEKRGAYILELGKVLDKGNENLVKNFGIPLMEMMLQGIQDSDTVERAFACNWIAYSYKGVGEFNNAIRHAENGIETMDEKFGEKTSPKYQTYCRLLLTAGEAYHGLEKYKEAATFYKRACLTLPMANDIPSSQRKILKTKIAKCRRANNLAMRSHT